MFVGAKHSGKTVAAASWMTKGGSKRVKIHDCDGRIDGLLNAPWIDLSRVDYDYFPPRTLANDKTFFERMNRDLEALMVMVNTGQNQYETYVGDSITAFTRNLVLDAIPLTHQDNKGRKMGVMNVTGVEEYKFEATGADSYLSFLRSLPLNIIVTGHVIPKWGKPPGANNDPYAERVQIGEELALRPKIAANVAIYFNHIFKFSRRMVGGKERFFVEFIGDIACTSFPNLEPGEHDITGKDFYQFVMEKVNAGSSGIAIVK